MDKKCLILGKGYIGEKLFKYIPQINPEIRNLKIISHANVDYTNQYELKTFLRENDIDFVINCYGYTGKPNVDACEYNEDECFERNVKDVLTIMRTCVESNVPFVHIDSGCVYCDESGSFIYSEKDRNNFGMFNPTASIYSKSKDLLQTQFKIKGYDKKGYIFRIRMPYDQELSDPKNYLGKILKYSKLVNYRNSLTNLWTLSECVEKLLRMYDSSSNDNPETGIYNVVDTDGITAKEILFIGNKHGIVNKEFTKEQKFYTVDELITEGVMKTRRSNCVLSNNKIIKNLGVHIPSSYYLVERVFKKQ